MDLSLERRRRLRREATDTEAAMWRLLRDRRLAGFKFRRQRSVGPFIVDFCCISHRLVIELDGGQHFVARALAYDEERSRFLSKRGLKVLRFTNDQVLLEREAVLTAIASALFNIQTKQRSPPDETAATAPPNRLPSPSEAGRGYG